MRVLLAPLLAGTFLLAACASTEWTPDQLAAASDVRLCEAFQAAKSVGHYKSEIVAEIDRRAFLRPEVRQAVLDGKMAIGMNSTEVVCSWGQPTEINRLQMASGTSSQWVYSKYLGASVGSTYRYVYLDDGYVTAVED